VGLLFIQHLIHEHGEPRWNDMNRRKPLIHPPELSGNPSSSNLVAKKEELAKKLI
jgi:hypothetical protein